MAVAVLSHIKFNICRTKIIKNRCLRHHIASSLQKLPTKKACWPQSIPLSLFLFVSCGFSISIQFSGSTINFHV